MKFVKATCPGCGATLELAEHLQSATCPNCGSKVLIEWETKQNPAANLELAKRFIQSGNYKEADVQLTRVLEMSPDNGEAWFWKSVSVYLGSSWGGRPSEMEIDTYLKRSRLLSTQMVEKVVELFSAQQLIRTLIEPYFLGYAPNLSMIRVMQEATWKINLSQISRPHLLSILEQVIRLCDEDSEIEKMRRSKNKNFIAFLKDTMQMYSQIVFKIIDALGADQPNDRVSGTIKDWRGQREVSERPSYWRQWIQNKM